MFSKIAKTHIDLLDYKENCWVSENLYLKQTKKKVNLNTNPPNQQL